jgi:hypothetical protein
MSHGFHEADGATGFREACEAVRASRAGKNEAEIRQMLADELRSRNIVLPPPVIEITAASIAAGDQEGPPPPFALTPPSLAATLGGKIMRRLFPQIREMADDALARSPVLQALSRQHPHPPGLGLYFPEPGQSPARAQLIPDPDIADRMPPEPPPEPPPVPPGFPRPRHPPRLAVWLEESSGTVVVHHSPGRIGTLSPADAEAYLPHIRAARAHGKVVAAMAEHSASGRGPRRVTIRMGGMLQAGQ